MNDWRYFVTLLSSLNNDDIYSLLVALGYTIPEAKIYYYDHNISEYYKHSAAIFTQLQFWTTKDIADLLQACKNDPDGIDYTQYSVDGTPLSQAGLEDSFTACILNIAVDNNCCAKETFSAAWIATHPIYTANGKDLVLGNEPTWEDLLD